MDFYAFRLVIPFWKVRHISKKSLIWFFISEKTNENSIFSNQLFYESFSLTVMQSNACDWGTHFDKFQDSFEESVIVLNDS